MSKQNLPRVAAACLCPGCSGARANGPVIVDPNVAAIPQAYTVKELSR